MPLDLDGAIAILLRKGLLGEALIKEICEKTKELLMRESNVVHISAPVTVVGDIHGCVWGTRREGAGAAGGAGELTELGGERTAGSSTI